MERAEERRAARVYQVGLDLTKTNKPTSSRGEVLRIVTCRVWVGSDTAGSKGGNINLNHHHPPMLSTVLISVRRYPSMKSLRER
jgi:hypothetical protein